MDRPGRITGARPVDADGVPIEPFRVTPGFLAFVSVKVFSTSAARALSQAR